MGFKTRHAGIVAAVYGVFGILWILFSDWFTFVIFGVSEDFIYYSVIKGLLFVLISTLIIFVLFIALKRQFQEEIDVKEDQLDAQEDFAKSFRNERSVLFKTIETSPVPALLHTEDMRIIAMSDSLKQLSGYDLEEVPTMRAWIEKAYPEHAKRMHEDVMRLYDTEGTIDHGTERLKAKDGSIFHLHWHSAFVGHNEYGLRLMLSTGIDITERKTREKELTHISYHDDLTGLYNRRYYEEIVKRYEPLEDIGIVLADINGLKLVNDVFGHTYGDELLRYFAEVLLETFPMTSTICRLGGDEFVILMESYDEKHVKDIEKTIKDKIHKDDEDIIPSAALGHAKKQGDEPLKNTFIRAENMLYKDKLREYNKQSGTIIQNLKHTMFKKTDECEDHIQRLNTLANELSKALDIPYEYERELRQLIELHDIGKISIDSAIFNKEGALSEEEKVEIEQHTEIGYRIANALPRLKNVAYSILTHHENVDGSGYPFGLSGKDIPYTSRLFRVIDSYENMTRKKHYRPKPISKQKALEELKRNKDKYYDADIVDAFVNVLSDVKA